MGPEVFLAGSKTLFPMIIDMYYFRNIWLDRNIVCIAKPFVMCEIASIMWTMDTFIGVMFAKYANLTWILMVFPIQIMCNRKFFICFLIIFINRPNKHLLKLIIKLVVAESHVCFIILVYVHLEIGFWPHQLVFHSFKYALHVRLGSILQFDDHSQKYTIFILV